jgi:hypothetical protein
MRLARRDAPSGRQCRLEDDPDHRAPHREKVDSVRINDVLTINNSLGHRGAGEDSDENQRGSHCYGLKRRKGPG